MLIHLIWSFYITLQNHSIILYVLSDTGQNLPIYNEENKYWVISIH